MAINFYEDLSVYNHVVVEGGFFAGTAVDTSYDLKIKGASLLQNTLGVQGIVTLSSVANASSDPDKFLCINGSNQVEYRTGAEVLSDIGAASSSSLSNYLPLAGGTMTGTSGIHMPDNFALKAGNSQDLKIYHNGSNSIIEDAGTGDLVIKFSNDLLIEGQDGANLINCNEGSNVQLYHNGSEKLKTKSTGIEVTGKVITTEIESASTILLDAAADITIDAGGQDIILSDDGTIFGTLSNSSGFQIRSRVNDADMFFRGVDNGTEFNALTLDMSAGGNATFAGDVLDRDIPCVLTSHFSDDSSTTSYLFVPFNNNSESSSNQYYNYFAAPQAGKVVSIMLMHVSGSMSSSFTTQLRVAKNGSTADTSGELTPSNGTSDGSYVEYAPGTVFAKGDRLQFSYQKSAGSKYWRGATATIVIELTDYDI